MLSHPLTRSFGSRTQTTAWQPPRPSLFKLSQSLSLQLPFDFSPFSSGSTARSPSPPPGESGRTNLIAPSAQLQPPDRRRSVNTINDLLDAGYRKTVLLSQWSSTNILFFSLTSLPPCLEQLGGFVPALHEADLIYVIYFFACFSWFKSECCCRIRAVILKPLVWANFSLKWRPNAEKKPNSCWIYAVNNL